MLLALIRSNYEWKDENNGFPGGSAAVNLPAVQETRVLFPSHEDHPVGGAWQPTPVVLPRKLHGQRSFLVGCSPWGPRIWTEETEHRSGNRMNEALHPKRTPMFLEPENVTLCGKDFEGVIKLNILQ